MVKNLSNPLNARKVARILADDISREGFQVTEREISVFLSDHRISDLQTAIKQLKQEDLVSDGYVVSEQGRDQLLAQDFIDESYQIDDSISNTSTEAIEMLGDININSIEFKTQLDSLKNKLVKSWSGGISIDGHELDNFDRKFSRPMEHFKTLMQDRGLTLTDLQAFAVIYATDHLTLGDNSKEEVYQLIFGRFDEIKEDLATKFSFEYRWPQVSGTSFIDIGKKFSIHPELAEFGKRFRSISGLDTYPDEVIQVFFFHLITGDFIEEMIDKRIIYRWADESETISDPFRWLLPPPEFNISRTLRELLIQVVITHTLLTKIEKEPISLLSVLQEVKDMDSASRTAYLAKKLEASLTRKSVALQFGTTLANFFENFKTNPASVTPFLDTTINYYLKTERIETLFTTIEHSIRTALKNSTGIIKQYLINISDEDLQSTIRANLENSITSAISETLQPYRDDIITEDMVDFEKLDEILRDLNQAAIKTFFREVFDRLYQHTNQYARDLEPQKEQPVSSEGGLSELTNDFISTAFYHGNKNWKMKTIINNMVENGLSSDIAEMIGYISSYITYQVASKEGNKGEQMVMSLIKNFEQKAHQLGSQPLVDGSSLADLPAYTNFIKDDLRQAYVLVALGSQIKTDAYNAWTPLESGRAKNTRFLNEFIVPNLLYWQRQPRDFVMGLLKNKQVAKADIKSLVAKTNRLSLVEAYSLLCMGVQQDINSFAEAANYLTDIFDVTTDLEQSFVINPKSGEAEIALESIYLWSNLQEVA